MIISVDEVKRCKALLQDVRTELDEQGLPYDPHMEVGIMIETPAAAVMSDELAKEVDFFSIGSNDLTQYTLAMDRQNPLLQKKYDDHHPAILKMIKMIVDAGHAQNCKVCLCGELAADTRLTETFLQMGVDALSVVPACILPVRKALRAVCIAEM